MADEKLDVLMGREFGKRLIDAGIIGPGVRRLVIDVPVDGPVILYVERFASRQLLRVVPGMEGVRITTVDAEAVSQAER
jgi:hypothetical protein